MRGSSAESYKIVRWDAHSVPGRGCWSAFRGGGAPVVSLPGCQADPEKPRGVRANRLRPALMTSFTNVCGG